MLRRPGVRQFVKFCLVGASSTLVDFAIYLFLMEGLHLTRLLGSLMAARLAAQSIAFTFSVTNGFIWNSLWTFKSTSSEPARRRYPKFVATNLIGLGLNLSILTLVAHAVPPSLAAFTGSLLHLHDPQGFIGKLCATAVVVFWNFTASKYWTFRERPSSAAA